MEEAGSYDTCSLLPPRRRRGPFIYGTDLPEVHPDGGTVCYHSPPLWGVERPFLRPLPSPIKDPAEAQKVNMGTIKSTWALDVLGVGLKMQRAVPERAHDVRLPLRRKIVEMWTLHCITVVTITRQCHEAAASKRASRSAPPPSLRTNQVEDEEL